MNTDLSQYMTPAWAARELWAAHFADLTPSDLVIEPTCGNGHMLQAIPPAIAAFGVELDPELAAAARATSRRNVITADIFDVELPAGITAAFGNPPFKADFMDRLLEHLAHPMPTGARCGFIVPAYFMQSSSRVVRWNRTWSVALEMLPRTVFPRLSKPIVFALFTKDEKPVLRGMRLYYESDMVEAMAQEPRAGMTATGRWHEVVEWALARSGGKAHLTEIYARVIRRRPTANQWWKEKVRQILQQHPQFVAHGDGVWSLA